MLYDNLDNKAGAHLPFLRSLHCSTQSLARRYIREYGAVVTSFQIFSDFAAFFDKAANARKVYTPSKDARFTENHAVVLVGYENDEDGSEYFLALNSWSAAFADNGLFRVRALGLQQCFSCLANSVCKPRWPLPQCVLVVHHALMRAAAGY